MEITRTAVNGRGVKFTALVDGKAVGRAFLYILWNDLHREPFGLLEDVFVDENSRGRGVVQKLLKELLDQAKEHGCYKIVATSRHTRPKVHHFYERLGFKNWGVEFRLDLDQKKK